MRVRNPDLLIRKLCAVDALRLSSIIIDDDLAALHHEARNDPLEDTSAVVQIAAQLTCAKSAEILNSSWKLIFEKLHDNATFLEALISLVSNLDIHEHLYVSHIKIWHPIVHTWVLIVIKTTLEYLGGCLPLALTLRLSSLCHFLLQCLIVLSESTVLWFELDSLATVSKGLREILEMQVG